MKKVNLILPVLTLLLFLMSFKNSGNSPYPEKDLKWGASVSYTVSKDQSSWGCQTDEYNQKPDKLVVEGTASCSFGSEKTAIIIARNDAKSKIPSCYKLDDPDAQGQISTWSCQ
jgi:hypothetical protein